MFLERPREAMPKAMRLHAVVEKVPPGKWGGEKPAHLTTLESSGWPEDVKLAIVRIDAAKGLPDPARQKLIEPVARIFGGRKSGTGIDLSEVDWGKVVDYFEWVLIVTAIEPFRNRRNGAS